MTTVRNGRHPPRHAVRAAGFTLLELMTTLAVVSVVLVLGVPSYQTLMRNSRATNNANELVTALSMARSEAIRRSARVSICRSNDGLACGGSWSDGWIIFADGAATDTAAPVVSQVLGTWPAPEGNSTVVTRSGGLDVDLSWIRFLPRGDTRTTSALPITYNMQIEGCIGEVARNVEINAVGRPSVTRTNCS